KTLSLAFALLIGACSSSSPGPSGDGGPPGPMNWLAGIAGTHGTLVTSDGASYTQRRSNTLADLRSLFCVNSRTGWVAGSDGTLLTTVDAGEHWVPRVTGVSDTLLAVAFADPEVGLVVGPQGLVLRSTDGGVHWSRVALSVDASLNAV